LDCYFDPNERKYYITPQSVERAIKEEQARNQEANQGKPEEQGASIPKSAETDSREENNKQGNDSVTELKKQIVDLQITNRVKDHFIEQLKKDREGFTAERREYVEKLMSFNRQVGELETKLLLLEAGNRGNGQIDQEQVVRRPVDIENHEDSELMKA